MQPNHIPVNTFHSWGDIRVHDTEFGIAAAFAASAVAAASEASSSPGSKERVDVSTFLNPQVFGQDVPAQGSTEVSVPPSKSKPVFKMCGENCDKLGCRLMRLRHNKRLVCTNCMPAALHGM